MRRGHKTSEGILSALVIAGQLAAALAGTLPAGDAGIGTAIVAAVFALSRGLTKSGGAEAFPALIKEEESTTDPHASP